MEISGLVAGMGAAWQVVHGKVFGSSLEGLWKVFGRSLESVQNLKI